MGAPHVGSSACFASHDAQPGVSSGAGGANTSEDRPTPDDPPSPDTGGPGFQDPGFDGPPIDDPRFDDPRFDEPPPVDCQPQEAVPPVVVDAEWTDPVLPLGTAGWQGSEGALCGRGLGVQHLWADDSGVYVAVIASGQIGGCGSGGVYFNGGAGWDSLDAPAMLTPARLDRMPNGNLINWCPGGGCMAQELAGGRWVLTLDDHVHSLHVSEDGVAHAIAG